MSVTQNAAVADNSGEVERQRQIAEHERQQQENRFSQQLKPVRQNAAAMLHEQAQSHREEAVAMLHGQAQSHREEASIALGYVNDLTETTLNRLNKQNQERQQMAANNERTRQRITAHKNQLRNKEQEKDSPDRAKPKAKSEPPLAGDRRGPPCKFQTISPLDNVESPAAKDDENPETTHEPKGKKGRPSNITRTIEKPKNPT